jgi:uncharacterized repeat protein (TIGR01451 family)
MKSRRVLAILAIIVAVLALLTASLASAAALDDLDCEALANSPLPEPEGYAEQCLGGIVPSPWSSDSFDPTDTAFALDIGFVSDNFVSHVLNNFPGQTVLGANAQPIFAMDFDETATTLYAIDNTSRQLGTLNLANGAFTSIAAVTGVPAAENMSGLAIDPSTGTAYLTGLGTGGMNLYTLNLATAAATLIANNPAHGLMIDISMGCEGVLYGHDINTDSIYIINTTTAATTIVGATGVNSNFAQGMDFDNADGTLYAYTYQGGGANVYGTINLATGALTPLASSNPQGEFEGATQTTCGVVVEPGIAISKSPANQTIVTGGNANFTITVTNTGNVDLANVNVTDAMVPACDNAIGALTVSQTVSYGCQDIGVTASYTNVVTVTSDIAPTNSGGGPTATASANVTVVPPTSVSLSGFEGGTMDFSPVWLVAILAVVLSIGFLIRRKLTA